MVWRHGRLAPPFLRTRHSPHSPTNMPSPHPRFLPESPSHQSQMVSSYRQYPLLSFPAALHCSHVSRLRLARLRTPVFNPLLSPPRYPCCPSFTTSPTTRHMHHGRHHRATSSLKNHAMHQCLSFVAPSYHTQRHLHSLRRQDRSIDWRGWDPPLYPRTLIIGRSKPGPMRRYGINGARHYPIAFASWAMPLSLRNIRACSAAI
jgi:hypothetical protein